MLNEHAQRDPEMRQTHQCVFVCYLAGAGEAVVVLRSPLRAVCVMFSLKETRVRVFLHLRRVTDEHQVIKLRLLHDLTAGTKLTAVRNMNLGTERNPFNTQKISNNTTHELLLPEVSVHLIYNLLEGERDVENMFR